MKTKIVQNIIATSSKISILIDESTTVSSLSGMVVYVKASILNSEPVFSFLDLVELKSQTASNIDNQLIECLHTSGFTENFLVEHWVSFVTDGASYSLYSLYSRSPKNQIELREHCTSLNEFFLKIGKVLDVRWVASSFRTISVIWKIYPALYNHLVQASKDTLRDSKTKSKYSGLSKRLGCIQFLLDLALMCDILFEISQLSLDLQKQDMSLLQADVLIRRTIRVIESLKTMDGKYYSEAVKAKEKLMFKTVVLSSNEKINKNQFITSVVNNLNMRLIPNEEVDIRFGEKEIQRICNRFCINEVKSLKGLRIYVDENDKVDDITLIEELKDINILIKTFPCSTAECERGFSLMNNIYYVESWLTSHRDADDDRSRKVATTVPNQDLKSKLWELL
ncbi:E3 SUMO-protein ligase KIAA1586-like [Acyrthosiphon pisum]|uniref:Uncharacterized protein n=1 Tax=Acyrthosiphon pisum TaxID=7029 RepID=A0A8R2AZ48_ACYPI|nr:E3 SUMO-protein ligase KIAA1586-like [Acyrthosiphon pisum]|eukprot:XP_008179456.1 PREDICTED: E3 SUMO-protein ligase KIAA1586-like [Acyrthosiphon pisum]